MSDDFKLKEERSKGGWFKYADPRPLDVRKLTGSKTIPDQWTYGANRSLEIRFEVSPARGFGVWFQGQRIGFSKEISPEPVPAATIRAAKNKAAEVVAQVPPSTN